MKSRDFIKENLRVEIYETRSSMGFHAADEVGKSITQLLAEKEYINIVFAAAPSQNEFLTSLREKQIDWNRINAFHMDEYVGLESHAPQLFSNYLKNILFEKVEFREVYCLNGAKNNLEEECKRYTELIQRYPTDIVILGIGENTHLAFNDPHVADFEDSKVVKIVDLDEKNRWQQVNPDDDICFDSIKEVPTHAITLTIPALFNAKFAYAVVPGKNKADAIFHTINSPIQELHPSTILRKHPDAVLYIDEESAIKL